MAVAGASVATADAAAARVAAGVGYYMSSPSPPPFFKKDFKKLIFISSIYILLIKRNCRFH